MTENSETESTAKRSVAECMARCPDFLDFPTAWAIQEEAGNTLVHDSRCSSVPGWSALSGPAFLCDCGAVENEYRQRRAVKC